MRRLEASIQNLWKRTVRVWGSASNDMKRRTDFQSLHGIYEEPSGKQSKFEFKRVPKLQHFNIFQVKTKVQTSWTDVYTDVRYRCNMYPYFLVKVPQDFVLTQRVKMAKN